MQSQEHEKRFPDNINKYLAIKINDYNITDVAFCHQASCPNFMLANINPSFDIDYNLARIETIVEIAHQMNASILVLPELVIPGYVWGTEYRPEVLEQFRASDNRRPKIKKVLDRIRSSLIQDGNGLKMVLFGNVRIDDIRNKMHDTAFVMTADTDYNQVFYDKIFLTPLEKLYFARGNDQRLVLDTQWGRLGVVICYDIAFVELGKRYAFEDEVDVIITLSAWRSEAKREYPMLNIKMDNYYQFIWGLMQSALAAHNQVWSIGANYAGIYDKSGGRFCGESGLWSPSGIRLVKASESEEELLIIRNIEIRGHMRHQAKESFNYSLDFNQIYREIKDIAPKHVPISGPYTDVG